MLYFTDDNKQKRFSLKRDYDAESPREWDGNLGTMLLTWNRMAIGDMNFHSPDDVISYIEELAESIPAKAVLDYVDKKEFNRPLVGDEDEIAYELIHYDLSVRNLIELLEENDYFFMDVYGYEHSGFTVSCSRTYPYTDKWDGGQAGFIYTTKEKIMRDIPYYSESDEPAVKTTDDNWTDLAEKVLNDEVSLYDQWLQNDVYGYIEETLEDGEWEETDSCWGFFSDKWGEALEEEIFKDVYGNIPFEFEYSEVA